MDRNGKWPTSTHNTILATAFPGLTKAQLQILQKASAAVDGPVGQLERNAYKHGMRAPRQAAAEAASLTAAFVAKNVDAAKAAQSLWASGGNAGLSPDALQKVGTAIHPVTDLTSPTHAGAQMWSPLTDLVTGGKFAGPATSIGSVLAHTVGEDAISPEQMAAAVAAAQAAFREAFGDSAAAAAICSAPNTCAK